MKASIYDRRWGDGEDGLREMCDEGARLLKLLPHIYDELRLECFNESEADFVASYMRANHPETVFHTTHLVFGGAA